jgi:hypothetical protein
LYLYQKGRKGTALFCDTKRGCKKTTSAHTCTKKKFKKYIFQVNKFGGVTRIRFEGSEKKKNSTV